MSQDSAEVVEQRCRQEIIDLHAFFDAWYAGREPDGGAGIERLEHALATDFRMISPTGDRYDRETVIGFVRDAEASAKPVLDAGQTFQIWTDQHELLRVDGHMALMNYIEWQIHAGDKRGRLSSAWFHLDDNGSSSRSVRWVHLHETWLPEGEE